MKLVTVLALCLCALVALTAAGQLSAQTSTMGTGTTTTLAPGSAATTTTSPLAPTTISSPGALPIAAATGTTSTGTTPTVLNVVEITRLVPAGTPAVTAFTVPVGQTFIVTDLLLTNTGTAGACGAALNRAGGSTTTPSATFTTPPTSTTTTNTGTTTTTPSTGTTTTAVQGTTTPALAGTITQTDSSITGPLCIAPLTTMELNLSTGIEFGPGQTVQLVNAPSATPASGTPATGGAVGFHLRGILVASSS